MLYSASWSEYCPNSRTSTQDDNFSVMLFAKRIRRIMGEVKSRIKRGFK